MNTVQQIIVTLLSVVLILTTLGFGFFILDETLKEKNHPKSCTTYEYYVNPWDVRVGSPFKLEGFIRQPYTVCR